MISKAIEQYFDFIHRNILAWRRKLRKEEQDANAERLDSKKIENETIEETEV